MSALEASVPYGTAAWSRGMTSPAYARGNTKMDVASRTDDIVEASSENGSGREIMG